MKRRIIWRIILALVILLALVLCVTKVIIPLFDTSDEQATFVPDIQRFAGTTDTFTMETDNLSFELDPETTHFTVTDKRTGKVWSSSAPGVADDKNTVLVEKNRLQSVLTLNFMNKTVLSDNFNTFEHSTANRLYSLEKLEDGSISVTYTVGKIDRIYMYPEALTDARFQTFLDALPKKDKRTLEDAYQAKGIDAKGKSKYKKTDDIAALEAQYPDLKDGVVWILRKSKAETKANNAAKIETALATAGYTAADYEYDESRVVRSDEVEGATDKPIFNITVVYRLEGDDLVVEVPFDKLAFNPQHPLVKLTLLPAFGAADSKTDGYILVPEGTGALINFNNGKTKQNPYYADMYGWDWGNVRKQVSQESRMIFPVFGMATEKSSFICIMEDGKSWAGINADVSGRAGAGSYNSVGSVYTILHMASYDVAERTNEAVNMFELSIPEGKLSQRYRFIASDDYMDMAAAYREYLFPADAQKTELNASMPTVIEMVGAIDKVQQRFGVPTNIPIPLTTYNQALDLFLKLYSENLPNMSIRYAGWMNDGLNQNILNDIRLMGEMGSLKELKSFIRACEEAAGVPLYLDGLVGFARNSGLAEGFLAIRDAARHTTREVVELPEYSTIWYGPQDWRDTYFLLKPSIRMSNLNVLSNAAREYGASGVSFRDVGNMLSADYNSKDHHGREEIRLEEMNALDALRQNGQKVMTRSGNDYAAVRSDIVTDIDFDGSPYRIIDCVIPFYTAALHGNVPYTGVALNLSEDREELLLRSAEMGAGLQFSLMASNVQELQDSWFSEYYGADASVILPEMVETIRDYDKKMEGVFNQTMTDHQRIGNVAVTEYANGIRVYVNYGYTDAEVDGMTVVARSYLTVKEAIE